MKKWNFKTEHSPSAISEKLKTSLGSLNGFVFNLKNEDSDIVSFKIRKRLLYAWYLIYENSLVVNGRLSKADNENETKVHITFSRHIIWQFCIFTHLFLGTGFVISLISGHNEVPMYLLAAMTLGIGVFIWLKVQKKHERNIQQYKNLISKTLGTE